MRKLVLWSAAIVATAGAALLPVLAGGAGAAVESACKCCPICPFC